MERPTRRNTPATTDGAYHGTDRRGLLREDRAISAGLVAAGTGTVIVVGSLCLARAWQPADATTVGLIDAQLAAAALVLTIPLAVLCGVRWRLVGEAAMLWLGAAAAVHGLLTLGVGEVVAGTYQPGGEALTVMPTAGRLVTFALIVAALRSPDVDATLRPIRIVGGALVVVAALVGTLTVLTAAGLTVGSGGVTWPNGIVAAGVWVVLAGGALYSGLRRRRQVLLWFGLAFLTFAAAELLTLPTMTPDSIGTLAPPLLHALGLLLAVCGATGGLIHAFVKQGGRLMRSIAAELEAESRVAAETAAQRERAHEARNALAAIEMATLALQVEDADGIFDRSALSTGVAAEVRRLAQLVDPTQAPTELEPFHVTDALVGLAVSLRGTDTRVSIEVPDHLVALGRTAQTTQVLHNLLQNARRYGGHAVVITGTLEEDQVVVRVIDDGPGVPEAERATIFDRGVRGSAASGTAGDGLGLHIASRLMAEQDGQLDLEEQPGDGGSCFALRLPAAPVSDEEVIDEREEPREMALRL